MSGSPTNLLAMSGFLNYVPSLHRGWISWSDLAHWSLILRPTAMAAFLNIQRKGFFIVAVINYWHPSKLDEDASCCCLSTALMLPQPPLPPSSTPTHSSHVPAAPRVSPTSQHTPQLVPHHSTPHHTLPHYKCYATSTSKPYNHTLTSYHISPQHNTPHHSVAPRLKPRKMKLIKTRWSCQVCLRWYFVNIPHEGRQNITQWPHASWQAESAERPPSPHPHTIFTRYNIYHTPYILDTKKLKLPRFHICDSTPGYCSFHTDW